VAYQRLPWFFACATNVHVQADPEGYESTEIVQSNWLDGKNMEHLGLLMTSGNADLTKQHLQESCMMPAVSNSKKWVHALRL